MLNYFHFNVPTLTIITEVPPFLAVIFLAKIPIIEFFLLQESWYLFLYFCYKTIPGIGIPNIKGPPVVQCLWTATIVSFG